MTDVEALRRVAAQTRETAVLVSDKVLFQKLLALADDLEGLAEEIEITAAASAAARALAPRQATVAPSSALTPKEVEVLRRLSMGERNKEISLAMGLQLITVKLHASRIFKKLGVRNRVEAANVARLFAKRRDIER
jgi:DNA-binding NarL/FixJ family response regulator